MSTPVQYVKNERGETTAVLMDIADYESLMEDIQDLAACAERRNEESISHENFFEELRKDGIL